MHQAKLEMLLDSLDERRVVEQRVQPACSHAVRPILEGALAGMVAP
jgi:hypothetical protein